MSEKQRKGIADTLRMIASYVEQGGGIRTIAISMWGQTPLPENLNEDENPLCVQTVIWDDDEYPPSIMELIGSIEVLRAKALHEYFNSGTTHRMPSSSQGESIQ